jgi:hypothetical protein
MRADRFLRGWHVAPATGIHFCDQGAYESIGVAGLDVWTAVLRGGMLF